MWGLGNPSDLRTEDQSAQFFRSHRGEVRKGFSSAGSRQGTRPPKGLPADLAAAARQARALGLRSGRRLGETRYGRVPSECQNDIRRTDQCAISTGAPNLAEAGEVAVHRHDQRLLRVKSAV